jgi:hypothetical protein
MAHGDLNLNQAVLKREPSMMQGKVCYTKFAICLCTKIAQEASTDMGKV